MEKIEYQQLAPQHFEQIITLGNQVHGDNYLDDAAIARIYRQSFVQDINASWVALEADKLVGFRLTFGAQNWTLDKWCTPKKWGVEPSRVCYFKCNTVDQQYRGLGVGSTLLKLSVEEAKKQGAAAGLAHIWLASPGNSAYRYFTQCGGKLVKEHPGKWQELSIHDGYDCPVCPGICECVGAEMLLTFD